MPKRIVALALLALALPAATAQSAAPAQQQKQSAGAPVPFSAAEGKAVVESLAAALEANFLFPEIGASYAAALRAKLASGGYSSFASGKEFAKAVTADLQAIHQDGHLRLHAPRGGGGGGPQRVKLPEIEPIRKAGWLAEGIAYISFGVFNGDAPTLAQVSAFMAEHRDAKALIIDVRDHVGGGLDEVDVIFPYLFDKAQPLARMDTRVAVEERGEGPFEDGPTLRRVSGPEGVVRRTHHVIPAAEATGLRTARVFLLTSKRTASAAEHLAMTLKHTGRGTLVGETTYGAGHFGNITQLAHGYAAFIPVGRTFDPDTNEGWEGKGVKPDVEVPADQALDEALRRAGVEPGKAKTLASLN